VGAGARRCQPVPAGCRAGTDRPGRAAEPLAAAARRAAARWWYWRSAGCTTTARWRRRWRAGSGLRICICPWRCSRRSALRGWPGSPWCWRRMPTARALSLRSAALRAGQLRSGCAREVSHLQRRQRRGVRAGRQSRRHTLRRVRGAQIAARWSRWRSAERARHTVTADGMTHILTLYNGERFEGVPGGAEFRIVRFAEHVVAGAGAGARRRGVRSLEARPTASLLDSRDAIERAELHARIAMPLMCAVLALLAGAARAPQAAPGPLRARVARGRDLLPVCQSHLRGQGVDRAWHDSGIPRAMVETTGWWCCSRSW